MNLTATTSNLGERALDVARSQIGVMERPFGSNDGPEIRQYLAPCEREHNGGPPLKLNLFKVNWCAAFASWCQAQALHSTERPAHGYRIGVLEIVTDVKLGRGYDGKFTGKWLDVKEARLGAGVPMPGDLAIYDRSVPGKPETNWWRHVNRVEMWNGSSYVAIGGNEQQRVMRASHSLDNPKLLGFVLYPRVRPDGMSQPSTVRPMLSDKEKEELLDMVAVSLAGIRDSMWKG